MIACFGSISRAPLAVMLMVAEMTGSLSMIVPAMVAVGLATIIVRRSDDTIYRSQLKNRSESPAHRMAAGMPLLTAISASQAAAPIRCLLLDSTSASTALDQLINAHVTAAPVTNNEGIYRGVVTSDVLMDSANDTSRVGDRVDESFAPIHQSVRLNEVLEILTVTPQTWAAVVDDDRHVIGTIAISDLVRGYRGALQSSLRRIAELNGVDDTLYVEVFEGSALEGRQLRAAELPRGVLITLIERQQDTIQPTGDLIFESGDRLTALGKKDDLQRLRLLASRRAG
jgi:hypothetical protein